MSKALAVQTSRLAGPKRFASSGPPAGTASGAGAGARRASGKVAQAQVQASKRGLHVSGGKEASAADREVNAERSRGGCVKQGRGML